MDRRSFLTSAGAATTVALTGCSGFTTESGEETSTGGGGETETETGGASTERQEDDTLVVGTYSAFIDAPSSSPGAWIKQTFEEEFDATLVWQTPSNELNHYVERRNAGVAIDADLYVGLNANDLVRVDENLDDALFAAPGDVEGRDAVKSSLEFDPQGRAVPYDTGYICTVYDGTQVEAPETFDGLLDEQYSGQYITQNPTSSATGRAFLLHTVKQFGEDGYLDYWSQLQDNDVRVLGSWDDAYSAWSNGEAPMVTSYSTDQVFANRYGQDLEKHQVRFHNDQGYAQPEGMAVFEGTDSPELARQFAGFMLRPEVQGEIAQRNVAFPATENAALPAEYSEYAKVPPEPVTHTYEELQGSVDGWLDEWSRQFAGN